MRPLVLAMLAVISLAAFAAGEQIATTGPAAANSPQQFQQVYREELNGQDRDGVTRLFLARTPGEAATVRVMVANEMDVARVALAAGAEFGVKVVGGGTLVPAGQSDQWRVEGDLASIPDR